MYIVYYTKNDNIFSTKIPRCYLSDFVRMFDWQHGNILSISYMNDDNEMFEE